MRKKIFLFIMIILIIVIFSIGGIILILKPSTIIKKKNHISGTQVQEAMYQFDLPNKNASFQGYAIKDKYIYYLESLNHKELDEKADYNLNRIEISTGKTEIVKNVKDYPMCYLDREVINCSNDANMILYDLDFNELVNESTGEEGQHNYLKYLGKYIKYADGTLYTDNEKIKVTNSKDDTTFMDYYDLEDNTYMLLYNYKNSTYSIFDIANKKKIDTNEINYKKYQNGFYFYTSTYYHVYDLKNGTEKKYNFPYLINLDENYISDIDKNIVYQYGESANRIEIIDLQSRKVSAINVSDFTEGTITSVVASDNLLYLLSYNPKGDTFKLFVIDMNNYKINYQTIEDYLVEQNTRQESRIAALKEKYNVQVKIKDLAALAFFPDFSAAITTNNTNIDKTLTAIENILSKFPENFFSNFYDHDKKGINIYIMGKLTPSDYKTQASNPIAYSLQYNDEYMMVLDSSYVALEETICHEMMHSIENNLESRDLEYFTKWDSLNPGNFRYNYSYTETSRFNYTPYETSKKNVYFLNDYSYTYPREDRAEIFGKMCSTGLDNELKEYPNLHKKALSVKEELIKAYPELKDSIVLEPIK